MQVATPTQQPRQLTGPQAVMQALWEQTLPFAVQFRQATPPLPHWVSPVPGWHRYPLQQPAQLMGPQPAATHAPALQTWPAAVQSTQVAPPLPQLEDD
jgi:hypothetical protein